jgi:hypothetical protein
LSKAEMQKAHEKLVRSLGLAPDDEEALEAVREVESMMKKKRVDFKKYARQ